MTRHALHHLHDLTECLVDHIPFGKSPSRHCYTSNSPNRYFMPQRHPLSPSPHFIHTLAQFPQSESGCSFALENNVILALPYTWYTVIMFPHAPPRTPLCACGRFRPRQDPLKTIYVRGDFFYISEWDGHYKKGFNKINTCFTLSFIQPFSVLRVELVQCHFSCL